MSDTTYNRQTAQNHAPTMHDVCELATGEKIGEVDHATFLRYLEEIDGGADDGAVDGDDYGFEGRTIYIED